jgi:hypothetical protein
MEQSLNFKTVTEMLHVPLKIYPLHVLFSNPDNKVEEHLVEPIHLILKKFEKLAPYLC